MESDTKNICSLCDAPLAASSAHQVLECECGAVYEDRGEDVRHTEDVGWGAGATVSVVEWEHVSHLHLIASPISDDLGVILL